MKGNNYPAFSLYDIQRIAESLGKAARNGRGWITQCPVHEDRTPSLSLSRGSHGDFLAHCFAGCPFDSIVTALKRRGLLPDRQSNASSSRPVRVSQPAKQEDRTEEERATYNRQKAKELWHKAKPVQGTLAAVYLQARLGQFFQGIPSTLRFLPSLRHTSSGRSFPAMIAAVMCFPSEEIVAVNRTYLASDERSKAPVEKTKMLLGKARVALFS